MVAQSIFTSQVPVSGNNSEPGGISTAVTFVPALDGTVTGVRFYASSSVGGTYTGKLWEPTSSDIDLGGPGTGNELGSGVLGGAPTPSAWNVVPLSSPVPVVAGGTYRVSLHSSEGHYVSTNNFPEFQGGGGGVTNGDLHAIENAQTSGPGDLSQGTFNAGASPVYPSNAFNASNYFVDVVFEADVPPAEGDAAFTLDLAVAATGISPNNGDAALGLVLTVATTGEAPPVPPHEGEVDWPVVATLSATGETPVVEPAEGSAGFTLDLALAATGDAPTPGQSTGSASLELAFTLVTTGAAPAPGSSQGSAAFTLDFAVASAGEQPTPSMHEGSASFDLVLTLASTGESDTPFHCRPVRSFSEVIR